MLIVRKEHFLQKQIVRQLRFEGWTTLLTDCSIALMFISNKDEKNRFKRYLYNMGFSPGQTDIVAFKRNQVIFIEVKVKDGVISDRQKEFISKAPNSYVIRSLNGLREVLKNYG